MDLNKPDKAKHKENENLDESSIENSNDQETKLDIDTTTDKFKTVVANNKKPRKTMAKQEFVVMAALSGDDAGSPLSYDPDRNSFVALVFTIVLIMLLFTLGIVIYVQGSVPMIKFYKKSGPMLMLVACGGIMAISYYLSCVPLARVCPCSMICLMLAVVFNGILCAGITLIYRIEIVVQALVVTIIIVLLCIALAMTSFDFTQFLIYVIAISMVFAVVCMVTAIAHFAFDFYFKPLRVVMLLVGSLLSVITLIIELQMILGGKTVEISEDDYSFAAFMVFTSIIQLFIQLVQILNLLDEFLE